MTSGENEREEATPPDGASDGMDLLIGWRAGENKAAGASAPDRSAAEPGTGAEPAPAATMADLTAGQQRILALLEDLAPKQAEAPAGEAAAVTPRAAAASTFAASMSKPITA